MRRLVLVLAAALALAAVPAASGQVFTVIRSQPQLPSYTVPNAPGSIRVPASLSRPPARPAVRSYEQLVVLWKQAGEGYGVPWQVLGAINKIESGFGQNMGPSSAGALGWMQFMPSTWMRWGMDGDGDGLADPWDPEDAVYAAARYLAAAGAHDPGNATPHVTPAVRCSGLLATHWYKPGTRVTEQTGNMGDTTTLGGSTEVDRCPGWRPHPWNSENDSLMMPDAGSTT